MLTTAVHGQAVQPQKRGPRALVPRTSSLDQAGGVQRITLRGHTGAITRVLLADGGIDVVTGAALQCTAAHLPGCLPGTFRYCCRSCCM